MNQYLLAVAFALGVAISDANAAEPKRIDIANDDHTDFMWTADADTYANVFVEMLDWHLKLADETATNAPPYRNRFNGFDHGLVARLWNLSEATAKAEITVTPGLSAAHRATHIETDIEAVPLTGTGALPAAFTRQPMQTYRLKLK